MTDKKTLDYDQEGEQIVHQQITEAYQSGVIDNVRGNYNVFTGEKQQTEEKQK